MDFCRLHQYRFERCAKANLSTDTDEQRLDRLRGFATCRQQGLIERVAGRQHADRAFEKCRKLFDDRGAAARSALREDEPADDDRENDKSRADKEAQDEKRQRDDQRNDDDDSQHDFGLKFNACPPYQMAQPAQCGVTKLSILLEAERRRGRVLRSEEHTSELQSLMRISYAVLGLKKKH